MLNFVKVYKCNFNERLKFKSNPNLCKYPQEYLQFDSIKINLCTDLY